MSREYCPFVMLMAAEVPVVRVTCALLVSSVLTAASVTEAGLKLNAPTLVGAVVLEKVALWLAMTRVVVTVWLSPAAAVCCTTTVAPVFTVPAVEVKVVPLSVEYFPPVTLMGAEVPLVSVTVMALELCVDPATTPVTDAKEKGDTVAMLALGVPEELEELELLEELSLTELFGARAE